MKTIILYTIIILITAAIFYAIHENISFKMAFLRCKIYKIFHKPVKAAPVQKRDWTDFTWTYRRKQDDEFGNMIVAYTGRNPKPVPIQKLRHKYTREQYDNICVATGTKDRFHLFGFKKQPLIDQIKYLKMVHDKKKARKFA